MAPESAARLGRGFSVACGYLKILTTLLVASAVCGLTMGLGAMYLANERFRLSVSASLRPPQICAYPSEYGPESTHQLLLAQTLQESLRKLFPPIDDAHGGESGIDDEAQQPHLSKPLPRPQRDLRAEVDSQLKPALDDLARAEDFETTSSSSEHQYHLGLINQFHGAIAKADERHRRASEVGTHSRPLRILISRLAGNNMPPLQATDQLKQNVAIVLNNEVRFPPDAIAGDLLNDPDYRRAAKWVRSRIPRGRSIHEVHWMPRLWVVNRIVNATARLELLEELNNADELVYEIPINLETVKLAPEPLPYLTNQGAARNVGVQEAMALGADWIIPLDGNVFLTEEGRAGIARAVLRAEERGAKYTFVGTYRTLPVANSTSMPDGEAGWRDIGPQTTLAEIFEQVTPMEAQMALRVNAPWVFPEGRGYGDRNKWALMDNLVHSPSRKNLLECEEANIGFDVLTRSLSVEQRVASRCGYVVRLPYWEDVSDLITESAVNEQGSATSSRNSRNGGDNDKVPRHLSLRKRGSRRLVSIFAFSQYVNDSLLLQTVLSEFGVELHFLLVTVLSTSVSTTVMLAFVHILAHWVGPRLKKRYQEWRMGTSNSGQDENYDTGDEKGVRRERETCMGRFSGRQSKGFPTA